MFDPWDFLDILFGSSSSTEGGSGPDVQIDPRYADYPWLMSINYTLYHGILETLIGGILIWLYGSQKSYDLMFFLSNALVGFGVLHILAASALHNEKRWIAPSLIVLLLLQAITLALMTNHLRILGKMIPAFWGVAVFILLWLGFLGVFFRKAGKRIAQRARPRRKNEWLP